MTPDYDVIILGGAFSGASAAILLRREHPELRVLIIEKSEAFDAKVGEATTEMSAMFITRRLRMWHHLEAEQLPKEGLRYWFSNDKVTGHANATEAGGFVRSAVPAFQLRRDALDEHLLATAVSEGVELMRPARVTDVELGDFEHTVRVDDKALRCRWLLDATGKATVIGRKLGIIDRNDEHPTAAIWCRWKNVRHIDDMALGGNISSRRLATNHYMGFGYWIWVIPLGNGETSIGVVFDKRLMQLKTTEFVAFLKSIPSLAELLDGATPRLDDLRAYAHLPYVARQYMGKGWALLGDAAAFLDPYYSPGLDHAAFSVEATVEIIGMQSKGEDIRARIEEHNETFARSYQRFFDSVYKDKYFYMGEADLLAASFLLDTAHYYIFVVIPAYRVAKKFVWMPVLGPKPAFFSYHLIKLYNRRFKTIAMNRRAAGEAGARNDGRRISAYFNLSFAPMRMALRGLRLWLVAEIDNARVSFRAAKTARNPVPLRDQRSEGRDPSLRSG